MTIALTALLPFLFALPTLMRPSRNACLWLLVVGALANLGVALASAVGGVGREPELIFDGYFVSDNTNGIFLSLIALVFLGVSFYVVSRTLSSVVAAREIHKFVGLALAFFGFLCAALLSNHLLLTWALLEASTLAVTPLVYYQRKASSYRAAWRYLLFSSVSLAFVLLGFACLARGITARLGSEQTTFFLHELFKLAQGGSSVWERLGFGLILFGYGSKLGLAPLYSWLPETYDEAPPSVTALLAAVQFNCVVLAMFRIIHIFRAANGSVVLYELMAMGLLSMIVATVNIVTTKNYKRLIAYASINHIGVISIGLGIGGTATYGTVLYVFSNALVKAMLFLTAGNIKARFHTKDARGLHGLLQEMPLSGFFLMVGIWALLGFAPFGSFLGEVVIMNGLVQTRHFLMFAAFCILTTVAFVAMGRTMFPMIWGETGREAHFGRESAFTVIPNIFFLTLLVSLGVYMPAQINDSLRQIATALGGG
jgi:hydrogenase-4 component F